MVLVPHEHLQGVLARRQCLDVTGVSGLRLMVRDLDYEGWLIQLSSSGAVGAGRLADVQFRCEALRRVMAEDWVALEVAISRLVLGGGGGPRAGRESNASVAEAAIPPIDAAQPAEVETATFALG